MKGKGRRRLAPTVDHEKWHKVWMRAAFQQMVRADKAEAELARARRTLDELGALVSRA